MENLSVSFVITRLDVWLSVFIWHHSTHELNVTLQQVNHLINEMFDKQRSRESFDSENCNCDQTIWHTTQFCERKHSVKRKKFSFINKNSKYTQSINQSTYFQCHLTLMLKLLQPNFKFRWQICSVIRTWEIYFDAFDSLTFINAAYALRMTSLFGST